MAEKITIKVHSRVAGYYPGHYVVDDSPLVRTLLKSAAVELVDPPSLEYIDNPGFLTKKEEVAPVGEDSTKASGTESNSSGSERADSTGNGSKSGESTPSSETTSAKSDRGLRKLTEQSKDDSAGGSGS